jgi:hypothetical protein
MTRPDEPVPPARQERGSAGTKRTALMAGLTLLVVVAIFVAVSWTHAPWRDYVHRKPASYVELTVARPAALPTTFVAGEVLKFEFSLHNVEEAGTHRSIDWVTSVRDTVTGTSVVAARGSATLEAGSTRTINAQVTVTGAHRSEVIVKLGSGQQVDFYVTPSAGAGTG